VTEVILLVEDNESDEKLALHAFKRAGVMMPIVVQRDGRDALDWLFATGSQADRDPELRPKLVLLDLKLPRVDGFEVLQQVRANPRTALLPVVVLTASKEKEDIVRSYSLGTNGYVGKPVDFAEFVEAARTLGAFWIGLNESVVR
jgi:two-component system, response regulator